MGGGTATVSIAYSNNGSAGFDLFSNLQIGYLWSATEYALNSDHAWNFFFGTGSQGVSPEYYGGYALAVRSGDVGAPIPEPGTIFYWAPVWQEWYFIVEKPGGYIDDLVI